MWEAGMRFPSVFSAPSRGFQTSELYKQLRTPPPPCRVMLKRVQTTQVEPPRAAGQQGVGTPSR